ncbi:MAG: PilZ domain [Planctomycetota bacterium]
MSPQEQTAPRQPSGAERRRWLRVACDIPVTLNLGGSRCEAKLRDLSRAGACFFLDRPVPMMTVLELSLELKMPRGVRRIRGQGAVVRCERIAKALDHYEIAVFLHEMAEIDRKAIEEFLAQLGTGPSQALSAGS